MPLRKRRKCQRCGKNKIELREIDTPAGRRLWCVECRTPQLPFKPVGRHLPGCVNPACAHD